MEETKLHSKMKTSTHDMIAGEMEPIPEADFHDDEMSVDDYLAEFVDINDAHILTFARNGFSKDSTDPPTILEQHPDQDTRYATPSVWPTYHSDEEMASPIDSDDLYDRSSVGAASFTSLASVPEVLVATRASPSKLDARLFGHAHAVVMKPVGRAKVIAVPKLIDIPAAPSSRLAMQTRSIPNLRRQYQTGGNAFELQRSARSSPFPMWSNAIDRPPAHYSPHVEHPYSQPRRSIGRLPSVPLIQAAAEALPFTQAAAARARPAVASPTVENHPSSVPRTLRKSRPSQSSGSPTLEPSNNTVAGNIARRMTKLGSSIHLKNFGRARNLSESSAASDASATTPLSPNFYHQSSIDMTSTRPRLNIHRSTPDSWSYYTTYDASVTSPLSSRRPRQSINRRSSTSTEHSSAPPAPKAKKLVARGADERAPPIVLPPFPDGEEDFTLSAMPLPKMLSIKPSQPHQFQQRQQRRQAHDYQIQHYDHQYSQSLMSSNLRRDVSVR